jgi:hypothetical protein
MLPAFCIAGYLFYSSGRVGKLCAVLVMVCAVYPNWMLFAMLLAWSLNGFAP